jgi:hypothetical protein
MLFFAGCGDEQLTIDGEQLSIDGEQLIIDSEQLTIDEPEEFDVRIEPPEEPEITLSPFEENLIVLTAQSLIGTQFRDGGGSPEEGFDNSGFIHYVLRENGYVNSPRGLQEQAVMGSRIESLVELRSGDLVFFSDNGERAQFGGIYIGDGIMISCRMPGEAVREIDITAKFYRENFFTAVRVL